jgi:glycogen synthase
MTNILHVLDHSLPLQSGYASRSHAILKALKNSGLRVAAVTSPKHGPSNNDCDCIDGVQYLRSSVSAHGTSFGVAGQLRTVLSTKRAIARYCRERDVDIIHAHSPCLNGLAAFSQGVPLVYEMRSSWEDAAVSEGITSDRSVRYCASRWLETMVARRAAAIVVICEGLKQELLARGIAESKITVVVNALPEAIFDLPASSDVEELRVSLGLEGARVLGYFGTFFQWEGVDALIKALPKVISAIPEVKLVLAGGGLQQQALCDLVDEMELERNVVFAGRIPHADIAKFYGLADLMVYPRVSNRLTEMVTPLKPLEAMAQRVPIVASYIGGHAELIEHGKTGYLYEPGNLEAMAAAIVSVLESESTRAEMAERAWRKVAAERRWSVVCQRYVDLYRNVASGRTKESKTSSY